MTNPSHMETTQSVYHSEYVTETPNYDFYPSLSRQLRNGCIHESSPTVHRQQPKDNKFIDMNHHLPSPAGSNSMVMENSTVSGQQLGSVSPHEEDDHPSWDLYPSILRNVENFGTEQMKQQLHAMEATLM